MDELKPKELLKECLPWVESYYKSRAGTDWKTGKNEARLKWIEQAKEENPWTMVETADARTAINALDACREMGGVGE